MRLSRLTLAAPLAVVAMAPATAPAAAPTGNGLTVIEGRWTCDGQATTLVSTGGSSSWLDGLHVVATAYVSQGLPTGKMNGFGDRQTCVRDDSRTIEYGTPGTP
jgi:hypothetical protein